MPCVSQQRSLSCPTIELYRLYSVLAEVCKQFSSIFIRSACIYIYIYIKRSICTVSKTLQYDVQHQDGSLFKFIRRVHTVARLSLNPSWNDWYIDKRKLQQ